MIAAQGRRGRSDVQHMILEAATALSNEDLVAVCPAYFEAGSTLNP